MAVLLKVDGTREVVKPTRGDRAFTLEELQKFVGGYIEVLRLFGPENLRMVVNEEGTIHQLPVNEQASVVYGAPIVGDALIVELGEIR